jgi:hypothetical protein
MPRFVDGDGGGGGGDDTQSAADQTFGKAPDDDSNAAPAAPAAAATEESEKSVGEETTKAQESSEEQPPEVTEEDMLAAISGKESIDVKVERLERERKASSTEAKRLKSDNSAYSKALEEQGLKAVIKDGKLSLIATEKYSEKANSFSANLDKLSAADEEALESGEIDQVRPVIERLIEKAKEAYVRIQPNLDKEPSSISDERKQALFESMGEAKEVDGEPKYENLERNKVYIETMINDPARSDAVRAAFAEDPEFMANLLNMEVNHIYAGVQGRKSAAKAATEKAKKEAENKAKPSVDGNGIPVEGSDQEKAATAMFGPSQ